MVCKMQMLYPIMYFTFKIKLNISVLSLLTEQCQQKWLVSVYSLYLYLQPDTISVHYMTMDSSNIIYPILGCTLKFDDELYKYRITL